MEDLDKYLKLDSTSSTGVRWIAKPKFSKIVVGSEAGNLDAYDGYYKIVCNRKKYKLHNVVWYFHHNHYPENGEVVDHKDRDRTNNLIDNLRLVSKAINSRNRGISKSNKTGINGVNYNEPPAKNGKVYGKYTIKIYEDGKAKSYSFSVQKYGKEQAKFMAEQKRRELIDKLNQKGYGYTEGHGT